MKEAPSLNTVNMPTSTIILWKPSNYCNYEHDICCYERLYLL